ncbi:MAG: S1 RNA-binding domain-containing protein [Anaerolineales bacterium]|nr:MAG: S1 RNA-binding domain-containing protein [Anaerolineales bacterium]
MADKEFSKPGIETLGEGWWDAVMAEDSSSSKVEGQRKIRKPEIAIKVSKVENDWDHVLLLMQEEGVVTGTVVDCNRGGLLVCNEKFQGFVPISHLDDFPELEEEESREERLIKYIGCQLHLKVIECDPKRGRIVLSERAAQTEPGQRQRLLESIQAGDVVQGSVTNITEFGVFVDLGGIEGLVHISEVSWGRVMNPRDFVELQLDINVLVLQVNRDKCRVSLSLKRLQPNPWKEVRDRYPSGTVIQGTVTQIVRFGAFTRLEEGLEGLIHISEMGFDHISSPWEILDVGQVVDVEVVLVDPERQRMSLRLVN